ncbi:hypothetical protein FDF74_12120 [Clostridium niameyense]|uniref:Phage tail assembly chaperone protein, TAC n=1 Tax=Clostridium niameyense TaxID=1622073 RepID=A0A6M0RDK5_9CLOT|nr:hypothetical protein [Clostridium niameyense]NEZ47927.1 hypothetical protein [Clostridium niameyense]
MNDIKQTGITVKLDKERHIIFDLNALCELEEKYNSIDKALERLTPKEGIPKMKDIRYIFYLGLKSDDKELTEEKVGSLINLSNINIVTDVIGSAMMGSLPESNNEKNK